jgi:plasmid stabilization system protein ParE
MPKQIVWSPLAEQDFENILEYLAENWDNSVTNQLIDLTEEVVGQISNNPRQYPLIFKKEKIRKCVLTKHNTLFYRDNKSQVDILRIYDTRQDPKTLTFK